MNNRLYSPIIENKNRDFFSSYISNIKLPSIDYIAVGIQNKVTRKSQSFMSNLEWQKHFITNQYAKYDPLREAVLNTDRKIIFFDEIDCINNFGDEIMRERKKFDINNGFIIVERAAQLNIMVTFGTSYKKFIANEFLKENLLKIRSSSLELSKMIQIMN